MCLCVCLSLRESGVNILSQFVVTTVLDSYLELDFKLIRFIKAMLIAELKQKSLFQKTCQEQGRQAGRSTDRMWLWMERFKVAA